MTDEEFEIAVQTAGDAVVGSMADSTGKTLSSTAESVSVGKRIRYVFDATGVQSSYSVEDF